MQDTALLLCDLRPDFASPGAQEILGLLANQAGLHSALHWAADTALGARIHVLMPYSDRLRDLAEWFRQGAAVE